ncbi:MAG: hypothetical protein ACRD3D_07415 [Terriglobia bacterium]
MRRIRKPLSPLQKKARRGFRGYPAATIALYGPDDRRATKIAVGIIDKEGAEPVEMRCWFVEEGDIREDALIQGEILSFVRSHGALTVITADRIIGCPHEEGVDYPKGQAYCPQCAFWIGRDRWSGEKVE